MRKSKNIDYIIGMARDFINGDLDSLSFVLDFNHEFITRRGQSQNLCKLENRIR